MPDWLDLPTVWAGIIAFAVLAYVVLDGFDLGVGLLFPLFPNGHERDQMVNTVAPVWDGNETWLVLGGGGLLAAFPLAYATVLPALYMPIILMLLGLILRGVAFEFRWRTVRAKPIWDLSFLAGSFLAAFTQGIALGALVQGIAIENGQYAGGWWDWLTPFSILTGFALVVGYGLLGATWLFMKTEAALQEKAGRLSLILGAGTLVLIGIVSLWTPFLAERYLQRWLAWPVLLAGVVVPVLALGATFLVWTGIKGRRDTWPFFGAQALFIISFFGIGISFYPEIVPGALSIEEAAAPDTSLSFLLVGGVVLLPLILIYTAVAYWVFRGKVHPDAGYH